ncbi:hypothetical protein [Mariniluteicoccus endophyticus]
MFSASRANRATRLCPEPESGTTTGAGGCCDGGEGSCDGSDDGVPDFEGDEGTGDAGVGEELR